MAEHAQGTDQDGSSLGKAGAPLTLLGALKVAAAAEVVMALFFTAAFLVGADPVEPEDWIAGGAWVAILVGYPIVVAAIAHRRPSTPMKLCAFVLLAAWPIALSASIRYA